MLITLYSLEYNPVLHVFRIRYYNTTLFMGIT